MNARHVNFAVLSIRSNRDDVTSFQVENPACMRSTMVTFSWDRDLNHGYHTAVHLHKNPSSAVMEDLQVDIVPSSGVHHRTSYRLQDGCTGHWQTIPLSLEDKVRVMLITADFHWRHCSILIFFFGGGGGGGCGAVSLYWRWISFMSSPEGWLISTNQGLHFYVGSLFFYSKAFSRIIFSIL